MSAPWSVAFLGGGRIAGGDGRTPCHAMAFRRVGGFRLDAVAERRDRRRRWFQRTWRVPRGYASVAALLAAERPDVVNVCTPTEWHFDHAAAALRARWKPRVLFVEKPLCATPGQLVRLGRLLKAGGTRLVVNHTRRFDPLYRRLAGWIAAGRLGPFESGRCTYYGGWRNNGVHWVDTLRLLLPGPWRVVRAARKGRGRPGDPDLGVELRRGKAVVVLEPVDEKRYQLFEAELRFRRGRIVLTDFGKNVRVERAVRNSAGERELAPLPGFPRTALGDVFVEAARRVRRALAPGRTPADGVGFDDAARTMSLIWRAALAAR